MKILLTGATGLIGKQVGQRLVRAGHEVRVLTRNARNAREVCPFPAEFIEFHGTHMPVTMLDGIEAVIHLAGESVAGGRWTQGRKNRIRESRVGFTKSLMEHVKTLGSSVKHVLMASAVGYYGNRGDELLSETSSVGADFLAEVCRDWEQELFHAPAGTRRLRRVGIRIGVVLSDRGGALQKLMPLFEKGLGGPVGSGNQWMSWIHLDDVVEMILFHIENTTEGIFNAVAPHPVTNRQFSKVLGEALGKPAVLPAPEFALWIGLGEMAQMILGGQRVSSAKTEGLGFRFQYPDLQGALKNLVAERAEGFHIFYAQQWLPTSIDSLFEFFSDEKNLEKITPPWLNFQVKYKTTPQMQSGTLINYELKLNGIPFFWQTLIEKWDPPFEFVDVQKKGPYSSWRHTHRFETLGNGTLMTDRVLYKIPMGLLGEAAAGWKVHSDVKKIFEFRKSLPSQVRKDASQ